MICPVCKRELAPTLSICLTCGAMMNDTVREELQSKVAPVSGSLLAVRKPAPAITPRPVPSAPVLKPAPVKLDTSDLVIKKTSPTLVGFQTRNATLPDWRLQLQNSIRQRNGKQNAPTTADAVGVHRTQLVTNGANALKPEPAAEPEPVMHENTKVANALRRIENSRKVFLPENPKGAESAVKPAAGRTFPFNVVTRTPDAPASGVGRPALSESSVKPRLISPLRIEKRGFDTNKLPPLPNAASISISIATTNTDESIDANEPLELKSQGEPVRAFESERIHIGEIDPVDEAVEIDIVDESEDEIDDLAPVAMRFNAGLFDCIIGGFASLLVLTPFMFNGTSWFTLSGFFAFVVAFAIVMFVYLTASIGFYGRTIGMRIFSLELIDAEENAYPTIHQAAVNSSVYLLSLAAFGIGFLPLLFNEEKRAAHDIASGTILIREL